MEGEVNQYRATVCTPTRVELWQEGGPGEHVGVIISGAAIPPELQLTVGDLYTLTVESA